MYIIIAFSLKVITQLSSYLTNGIRRVPSVPWAFVSYPDIHFFLAGHFVPIFLIY